MLQQKLGIYCIYLSQIVLLREVLSLLYISTPERCPVQPQFIKQLHLRRWGLKSFLKSTSVMVMRECCSITFHTTMEVHFENGEKFSYKIDMSCQNDLATNNNKFPLFLFFFFFFAIDPCSVRA